MHPLHDLKKTICFSGKTHPKKGVMSFCAGVAVVNAFGPVPWFPVIGAVSQLATEFLATSCLKYGVKVEVLEPSDPNKKFQTTHAF